MAALSAKPVNPRDLNPYRARRQNHAYTIDELRRAHRAHVAGGREIVQTITLDQVVVQ